MFRSNKLNFSVLKLSKDLRITNFKGLEQPLYSLKVEAASSLYNTEKNGSKTHLQIINFNKKFYRNIPNPDAKKFTEKPNKCDTSVSDNYLSIISKKIKMLNPY